MDQNGDNSLIPDTAFSFQRLLFGDDWHRWDTYLTVDANAISPDPTAEMNRDSPTIVSESLLMSLTWVIIYYLLFFLFFFWGEK